MADVDPGRLAARQEAERKRKELDDQLRELDAQAPVKPAPVPGTR
jgi:hypothetical protein